MELLFRRVFLQETAFHGTVEPLQGSAGPSTCTCTSPTGPAQVGHVWYGFFSASTLISLFFYEVISNIFFKTDSPEKLQGENLFFLYYEDEEKNDFFSFFNSLGETVCKESKKNTPLFGGGP
jgi:hypothetical protein